MKNGKLQRRRQVSEMRRSTTVKRRLTVGELVSAAFDALGDARQVVRVLGSGPLSRCIGGRKLVFI